MKTRLILFSLLAAVSARADLLLEMANRHHGIVYRDGERVIWEACLDGAPKRGCAQGQADRFYAAPRDNFVRSVQTFYGLSDRYYGGVQGLANLETDLSAVQRQLDSDALNTAELKRAEGELLDLSRKREKTEQAERELLQYLESGNDSVLNQKYQGQRYLIVDVSFNSLIYLGQYHAIYALTSPLAFSQRDGACQAFGKDWAPVTGHDTIVPLFSELRNFPVVAATPSYKIWTGPASEGWYTEDSQGHVVNRWSLEEWHRYGSRGGVMFELHYHPAATEVIDLAADPREAFLIEPTEASEGVLNGSQYAVLCTRGFDFSDNSDAGYVNGEHFADFSIYHLESSLENMAKSVYANRAEFFRAVAKQLRAYPLGENSDLKLGFRSANARLFALLAVEPVLQDIQSRFVDNYVLPDYRRAKEQWTKTLGAQTLNEIELSEPVFKTAIAMLVQGLKASETYLNADDKKAEQALVPMLGRALAGGLTMRQEVTAAVSKNASLFQNVAGGRRSSGFGAMAKVIVDYLEHQTR